MIIDYYNNCDFEDAFYRASYSLRSEFELRAVVSHFFITLYLRTIPIAIVRDYWTNGMGGLQLGKAGINGDTAVRPHVSSLG